jgi:hypothetical protein
MSDWITYMHILTCQVCQLTADLNGAKPKADYIRLETRQHPIEQTLPTDLLMNIHHLPARTLKGISVSGLMLSEETANDAKLSSGVICVQLAPL